MKFLKNKKANLPVTLFVIGVFALCAFALITFFISDFKVSNSFVGLDVMQKMNSNIDEYHFYENQGIEKEKRLEYFETMNDGGATYFYLEKSSSGGFLSTKGLLFSVKYPVS